MLLGSCIVDLPHQRPRNKGRCGMRRRGWGVQRLAALVLQHLQVILQDRHRLVQRTLPHRHLARSLVGR
uniref:Uncharacterized protein n=1 Tax=Arundo donax TaxID=35708 RepID=A0A0A9ANM2_ARUDO